MPMGDNATPSRFSLARGLDERPFRFVSIANQPTASLRSAATQTNAIVLQAGPLRFAVIHPASPHQIAKRFQGFRRSQPAPAQLRLVLERRSGMRAPLQRQPAED